MNLWVPYIPINRHPSQTLTIVSPFQRTSSLELPLKSVCVCVCISETVFVRPTGMWRIQKEGTHAQKGLKRKKTPKGLPQSQNVHRAWSRKYHNLPFPAREMKKPTDNQEEYLQEVSINSHRISIITQTHKQDKSYDVIPFQYYSY